MEEIIKITRRTADLCKKLIKSELERAKVSGIYTKNFVSRLEVARKELECYQTDCNVEELLILLKEKM